MECVNCFIMSHDGSLFHTSNVMDNFEHTKCGSLLKSTFHHERECRNENETSSDTQKDTTYHYPNCDSSVWMRSCEHEVIEPIRSGAVSGKVPKWLKGVLLRNGPGNLKVGEHCYQHLFDSSALLHKFGIADGEITYQRRFVQTEVYKKNMAAQRIVFDEFGTCATPDPCQSIFQRVATIFNRDKEITDNSMISIYPFGDEYYTYTETPIMHRIDPKTLETTGRVNMSEYINIVHHTAHPFIMADGTVYNVGMSITPWGPRYNVVRFCPNCVTIDDSGENKEFSMFDQATIVASVPSRWLLNPSYMHSFGITENYFIIVEQPLAISFVHKLSALIKQEPMISSFKWYENENTLIHVLSRETGNVAKTFVAETFFYLHTINQFECCNGEYIVLDICCYRNPKMVEYMFIESMKNMHENADIGRLFRARPLRFILPMKQLCSDVPTEYDFTGNLELLNIVNDKPMHREVEIIDSNTELEMRSDGAERTSGSTRNKLESALQKKPVAQQLPDGRVLVKPELLCDIGCETPRINADFHLGKKYRYFYAISCDLHLDNPGTLIKVDTLQKTRKIWQEKGIYPSEPIFVPDPNGKNEDDGVVISSLVWSEEETRAGLLILDAVTFTEIARATFDTPGPVPKCLHGWFSLQK